EFARTRELRQEKRCCASDGQVPRPFLVRRASRGTKRAGFEVRWWIHLRRGRMKVMNVARVALSTIVLLATGLVGVSDVFADERGRAGGAGRGRGGKGAVAASSRGAISGASTSDAAPPDYRPSCAAAPTTTSGSPTKWDGLYDRNDVARGLCPDHTLV